MTTHVASVEVRAGARYPFVPVCTCGWYSRGFVAHHAAEGLADSHADNPDNPDNPTV